jgi:hypothetical protein
MACVDRSAVSVVATCPSCEWRMVTTDRRWLYLVFLEHLDASGHPRPETKTLRDSLKRWLARNSLVDNQ